MNVTNSSFSQNQATKGSSIYLKNNLVPIAGKSNIIMNSNFSVDMQKSGSSVYLDHTFVELYNLNFLVILGKSVYCNNSKVIVKNKEFTFPVYCKHCAMTGANLCSNKTPVWVWILVAFASFIILVIFIVSFVRCRANPNKNYQIIQNK